MPLHIDVFALFIFLGTVQGIFLSLFFLSKENRSVKSNIFLGLLLIAASLLSIDILLSYTNAMFSVIYLVDVTEPLNFVIGPAFYLYVFSKLDEERVKRPKLHFIPALMYLIYATLFFVQSTEGKYNSYLDQYHPELPFAFAYPKDLTPSTFADGEAEIVLLKGKEAEREVQIVIRAFDESGPLTVERIQRDLPEMVIDEPQNILIGPAQIPALLFWSEGGSAGRTREVWFIQGGYLYQITGSAEMDETLAKMMETWRFE